MFCSNELMLMCSRGLLVVVQVCRQAAEGQMLCHACVRVLTPVFSLIRLHKSSSLLFFLIKSDNIWCLRDGSFNVANVTAGVILAILAICFMCHTFIRATSKAATKAGIQSFKPPLCKPLKLQP